MSLSAKPPEAKRRGVIAAVSLVIFVAGCSVFASGRHAPSEKARAAEQAPAAAEELVGPPAPPPRSAEVEGPPELVGPPPPTRPAPVEEPAEQAPVRESRASAPDAALLAALARLGADTHPSARGPVVVLPDTIFELGTSILRRDAKRKVHDIGRVLSERAFSTPIAVEGHSDSTGAEMYNQGLSQRRASAVAAELAEAGVAKKFLRAKGLGSQFPIAPNERADGSDDPEGRARNRRVEIVVENALAPGA